MIYRAESQPCRAGNSASLFASAPRVGENTSIITMPCSCLDCQKQASDDPRRSPLPSLASHSPMRTAMSGGILRRSPNRMDSKRARANLNTSAVTGALRAAFMSHIRPHIPARFDADLCANQRTSTLVEGQNRNRRQTNRKGAGRNPEQESTRPPQYPSTKHSRSAPRRPGLAASFEAPTDPRSIYFTGILSRHHAPRRGLRYCFGRNHARNDTAKSRRGDVRPWRETNRRRSTVARAINKHIRIDEELWQRLEEAAKDRHTTANRLLAELATQWLEDQQWPATDVQIPGRAVLPVRRAGRHARSDRARTRERDRGNPPLHLDDHSRCPLQFSSGEAAGRGNRRPRGRGLVGFPSARQRFHCPHA